MNLDGKYAILGVRDGSEHVLLEGAPAGSLMLFGRIEGETTGVGLWMTVIVWIGDDGIENKPVDETPRLVQWRSIFSARIVADGIVPKAFGFKRLT